MKENKETPEEKRERLRREEMKRSAGSLQGSNLSDLVGGLGWKGTGILILLLLIGFVIASVVMK